MSTITFVTKEELKEQMQIPYNRVKYARQSGKTTAIAELMREDTTINVVYINLIRKNYFLSKFPDLAGRVFTLYEILRDQRDRCISKDTSWILDTDYLELSLFKVLSENFSNVLSVETDYTTTNNYSRK